MAERRTDTATGTQPARLAAPPRPPTRSGPGLRPAMVVVGLAVLIVAVFAIGAALSGSRGAPAPGSGRSHDVRVAGTTLVSRPAAADLAPIEGHGEPPRNILDAVRLPGGASAASHADNSNGAGQYDRQMRFSIRESEAAVIGFYRHVMPAHGWSVFSTGAPRGSRGYQILGKKAGSDGWYWEMGAVVSPTRFHGSGGAAGGTTEFTIRLFQVADAS